jgi:hypothetical protein
MREKREGEISCQKLLCRSSVFKNSPVIPGGTNESPMRTMLRWSFDHQTRLKGRTNGKTVIREQMSENLRSPDRGKSSTEASPNCGRVYLPIGTE